MRRTPAAGDAALHAVVGLARALRSEGVDAGPARVHTMLDALGWLEPGRTSDLYWSGRLTLCASPGDLATYDRVFTACFGSATATDADGPRGVDRTVRPAAVPAHAGPAEPPPPPPGEDASHVATASRLEVLRHRDLVELDEDERAEVNRLLALLAGAAPRRRSRRRAPGPRGPVDVARTARATLRQGGEVASLRRAARVERPRRTVFLVDVSGSMGPYADAVLRVAHATCRRRPSTEAFTLGTRLTRVTRELRRVDPDRAMAGVAARVPDWGGGTRLGEQLGVFLDGWGRRGVARGAVVVLASDGWERGDPRPLGLQAARLALVAHAVVWISPHAGREGFAPLVAGLAAALPSVDALVAGHDLAAMERLVRTVAEVGSRA